MTALAPTQLPLELPPHRNHYLFSGYYLDNRVQERPEWQAADAEAQAALATLTALWQQTRPETRNLNESQTEQQWIQPVLDALGHRNSYNVQVSIETSRGTKKPDYIFYPGSEQLKAAQQRGGVFAESDLVPALAVGDAKAWGRSLDVAAKGTRTLEQEISANPSVQIDFYIRHTGRPWGILTDGQYWRLYHRDTSKKLDVYYEVDLLALLEAGDLNAFKFFYLFFRRDAFTTGWLQAVLDESHSYERGVSKNLRDQVYEALRELAQGFLDYTPNGLQPTPETLRAIYDNSLIVLYRLLFILYAESRDLLPLKENAAYRESYSLDAIKNRIARDEQQGRRAVPSVASLWAELRGLWTVLNEGNSHLGVPAYNGGLFNPERHPFLEKHRVGDAHLRAAIDGLARVLDPETGRREFVDYRDLEVRHLGSIYEGLLEYNLQVGEDRRVALLTDKGERKATGSYYTPDYIVQYIVEQAVGPLLDALEEQHQPEGSDEGKVNFARAVLNLNVLDPATGSGHFLVAATDFIARRLVEQEVDTTQGLEGEAALNYWRRRVVQSCIYGVDLNPLAIELAKLSLWLNTVARDKPLSFLDHHLRAGNSLVGARVADLGIGGPPQGKKKKPTRKQEREQREALEAGQQSMLEDEVFLTAIRDATGFMEQIEALQSDTLDEVHEAERIYREQVRAHTEKYRALADVWTARHFGLGLDDTLWAGLVQHTLRGGFDLPRYAEVKAQAHAIAARHRFFHWELEFPEVFFNERGQVDEQTSGFNAVIGNPPYVSSRNESFYQDGRRFINERYEVAFYQVDLYYLFTELAFQNANRSGYWSFIVPDTWIASVKAAAYRSWITQNNLIRQIVIPQGKVFDADVDSLVVVCTPKHQDIKEGEAYTKVYSIAGSAYLLEVQVRLPTNGEEFPLSGHGVLLDDIDKVSIPLYEISLTGRGIGAYHKSKHSPEIINTRAFHATQKKDVTYLPELGGDNIGRYGITWDGSRWISYGQWLSEPRDPALFMGERLLCRKILADKLVCTFTNQEWLVDQQVYVAAQFSGGYHAAYATAILTSSLIGFYARKKFHEEGLFPHLRVTQFRQLPIRRVDFTTPTDQRGDLLAEGQRLYEQGIAAGDHASLLAFTADQLDATPERADVIHDLLAFLAQQMIDLNRRKQQATEDFWLDLEGITDSAIVATFRKQGKQEASLARAEALRPFVDENSHSSRALADTLAWNEDAFKAFAKILVPAIPSLSTLVRTYRAHAPTYTDLTRRLAATDRLIDHIVYQLYRLTPDEIALVEQS